MCMGHIRSYIVYIYRGESRRMSLNRMQPDSLIFSSFCVFIKFARDWFAKRKINVLERPSQSPDINPIEILWNDVDKEVKKKKPTNFNELEVLIKECWTNIPVERRERLVDSIPRRVAEVIHNKGFATRY